MEGLKNNQAIETSGGCCRRAISRKGHVVKQQTFENKLFRAIGVARFANRKLRRRNYKTIVRLKPA